MCFCTPIGHRAFLTTELVKGAGFHPKGTGGKSYLSPPVSLQEAPMLFVPVCSDSQTSSLPFRHLHSLYLKLSRSFLICLVVPHFHLGHCAHCISLPGSQADCSPIKDACVTSQFMFIYIVPSNRTLCSWYLPARLSSRLHFYQGCLRNITIHVIHIFPSNRTLI